MVRVGFPLVGQLLGVRHQGNPLVVTVIAQEQVIAPMRPPALGDASTFHLVRLQPAVRAAVFFPAADHARGGHLPTPPLPVFPVVLVILACLAHHSPREGRAGCVGFVTGQGSVQSLHPRTPRQNNCRLARTHAGSRTRFSDWLTGERSKNSRHGASTRLMRWIVSIRECRRPH